MRKWMIVKHMFMTSAQIVEKGFLDEESALVLAKRWDSESDAYTSYNVEAYEDDTTIEFGKIKLNIK